MVILSKALLCEITRFIYLIGLEFEIQYIRIARSQSDRPFSVWIVELSVNQVSTNPCLVGLYRVMLVSVSSDEHLGA